MNRVVSAKIMWDIVCKLVVCMTSFVVQEHPQADILVLDTIGPLTPYRCHGRLSMCQLDHSKRRCLVHHMQV